MTTKQTQANKRWQEKNRERARYLRNRSAARTFVNKHGNLEDLLELQEDLKRRIGELNGQNE